MRCLLWQVLQAIFLILNIFSPGCNSLEVRRRIVGKASNAAEVQFLYHVFVDAKDDKVCNGALISYEWVITAAQCVANKDSIELWFGYPERNETVVQIRSATEIKIHPDYNEKTHENDIALVKLSKKAEKNRYTRPVEVIPVANDKFVKKYISPTGYGVKTRNATDYPEHLRYSFLQVIPNKNCKKMYKDGKITDKMLCAKAEDKYDNNLCRGDGGAPGTVLYKSRYPLIAIYSFSSPDCRNPNVFTRVSSYLDWIKETSGVEPGTQWE